SPQVIQTTPTFYKADGTAIVGEPITLQPAEMRFVTIASLIPEGHRSESNWGGISFSFFGTPTEVWAQITIPGQANRGSSDVVFSVLDGQGSDTQEAVWWQPRPGKRTLALGNSSDASIATTVELSSGDTQTVTIPPHGTQYLSDNLSSGTSGGDSVKLMARLCCRVHEYIQKELFLYGARGLAGNCPWGV
ncbi:MAG: hypothetical protein ACJ73D_12705, partial [Pyrinomonadaceae bacterium]